MSNENQKPIAPAKDVPASARPAQQSQSDAKPGGDKPAEQQK
jgi:hypothetical protein